MKIKHLSIYALMLALGVIANYIEHLIPLPFLYFGVKLGLANAIGLIVLNYMGKKSYVFYGLMRVLLSALLFTGFGTTFLIALGGTILASFATILIVTLTNASIYGISMFGAVFHGIGQIIVVCILYQTVQMLWYVLILAVSGTITGILMAFITSLIISKLPKKLI